MCCKHTFGVVLVICIYKWRKYSMIMREYIAKVVLNGSELVAGGVLGDASLLVKMDDRFQGIDRLDFPNFDYDLCNEDFGVRMSEEVEAEINAEYGGFKEMFRRFAGDMVLCAEAKTVDADSKEIIREGVLLDYDYESGDFVSRDGSIWFDPCEYGQIADYVDVFDDIFNFFVEKKDFVIKVGNPRREGLGAAYCPCYYRTYDDIVESLFQEVKEYAQHFAGNFLYSCMSKDERCECDELGDKYVCTCEVLAKQDGKDVVHVINIALKADH